jgi:hypothetical protein
MDVTVDLPIAWLTNRRSSRVAEQQIARLLLEKALLASLKALFPGCLAEGADFLG